MTSSIRSIDGKAVSSISTIDQPNPTIFVSDHPSETTDPTIVTQPTTSSSTVVVDDTDQQAPTPQDPDHDQEQEDVKSRPARTTMEGMIWNGMS
jgi:hypothetical protein